MNRAQNYKLLHRESVSPVFQFFMRRRGRLRSTIVLSDEHLRGPGESYAIAVPQNLAAFFLVPLPSLLGLFFRGYGELELAGRGQYVHQHAYLVSDGVNFPAARR
jgi:hypothetical protein